MTDFGLILGGMVVLLAAKPALDRARLSVRAARRTVAEVERRRRTLSHQVRVLARESLHQRLTAGHDEEEVGEIQARIAGLQRRVQDLEEVDRRVLVLDERRGLSERGWIVLLRRDSTAAPPQEPAPVSRLWSEGRYLFCYATDPARARRKLTVRFPEEGGFQVVEVFPHEGDLTEIPKIGAEGAAPLHGAA
ncbi:hypothetical protein [Rhodospirillum centenum]|uniref:Uncharacterized protein n=1 Tax=Rhodospirillum centenum (strain ATCC 51521 / SW) TaxID=414684 RepID=B6IRI0_RHOCS|nr:hypothetical protein [Rhodospirillum centenum]ACI98066.1 hypothetical protein RC1_0631 [Rhodospirillum centenum SW]